MSRMHTFRTLAICLGLGLAATAQAEDISTKKMQFKNNADPAKKQLQVLSLDASVLFSAGDDPATQGASIHVYGTDSLCVVLGAGAEWVNKGSAWQYKNKETKNSVALADGKLQVKLKSGVNYDSAGSEGDLNVEVQLGSGTRYCMHCLEPTTDDEKKFSAKDCAPAACDTPPSPCEPSATTTTTSSTTSTTLPPLVLQGALTRANGRFNYAMTLGLAGSDAACATSFPGTHTCTVTDLLAAESAGDLDGLRDTGGTAVTSLWAIDAARPGPMQCESVVRWDYATAHFGQVGERMLLNNATGDLGAVVSTGCSSQNWVGCCL